jgi:hypothetical protein
MVGESGFEPPTSCSQGTRANQAALLPDFETVEKAVHSFFNDGFQKAWSLETSRIALVIKTFAIRRAVHGPH